MSLLLTESANQDENQQKKRNIVLTSLTSSVSRTINKTEALKDKVTQINAPQINLLNSEKALIAKQELSDDLFIETRCSDEIKRYTSSFTREEAVSSSKNFYTELISRFETHQRNEFFVFVIGIYKGIMKKRRETVFGASLSDINECLEVIKESSTLTQKIDQIKEDVISFLDGKRNFKNSDVESFFILQERRRRYGIDFIKKQVIDIKKCFQQQIETREKILFEDYEIDVLINPSSPLILHLNSFTSKNDDDKKFSTNETDEKEHSHHENKKYEISSDMFSGGGSSTVTSFSGNDGITVIKRLSKRGAGGVQQQQQQPTSARKTRTTPSAAGGSVTSRFLSEEDASSLVTGDDVSLQAKINECRAQFETRSRPLRPFEWGEKVRIEKDISKPKSAMTLKKSLLADVFDDASATSVRSAVGVFGVQAAIWTIRKDRETCHPFVRFAGEELKAFQIEKALADIEDTFHGGIPLDKYSAPQFDKRFLETHTKLALMESLVSTGGGLVNGSKASEISIAEDIARLFSASSFFDSDKDSHLMSMLFPLLGSYRLTPGTSHWDNVGRALISTFPQKNVYDSNVGVEIWAELTAQKKLIEMLREWIVSKSQQSSSEEVVRTVCERKLVSWIFKRTGEGYKTFSSSRLNFDDATLSTIGSTRDEFDVLYQPRSGQISKPGEVFKAIANDPFFRRNFGLFAYEMSPDIFQRYSEIGMLTHDYLRFREENFQSYRHEHGRDQARFLDERADLNERSDMASESLPFARGGTSASASSGQGVHASASSGQGVQKKRTLKMVSDPFCDETVLCDRGIAIKQNQGGRASWHLAEAARVTGERNVYMSASPEDLEWDSTKEANCVLMFFDAVRKGMVEDVDSRRKQQIERIASEFEFVKKILEDSSLIDDVNSVENLIEVIVQLKHQDDVNAVIDAYLTTLRDRTFLKVCQVRAEEFKKEIQRSVTVRTVGGFAREDSSLHNPVYDTWHLKWATSSLSHALEKDNRDRMMGKFAARILWQTYVCVPKTDLGSACGASWYKFDEMGHNLRPITGTSEIIDDIVKYIGGIVTPSAETSAVIGDRTVRKHKTLEGNVRLNPIQLETIMEGGNRLLEISKTLTEIKKMINTDRGCKTIIDAMKTEKLIRCEQFNSLKNTDPNLVAFLNGVFDTGGDHEGAVCSFRSGKIEDFITMSTKMAVPYGGMIQPVGMTGARFAAANTKTAAERRRKQSSSIFYSDDHEDVKFMMNYLKKVFPDEEILSYAIRDMASMFFGANGEKIFRIWSGGGNNSKSILVKILQYGFGDYCFDLPAESICSKQIRNPSGPSPELAQGEGTRIGVMTEPADGVELDSGIIKRFTGGDRIHVRKLHENGGSIVASYKLILCCNDPPHLSQIDTATKNRVVILPFVSTWVDNPPPTDEAQMAARRFKIDPSFQAQAPRLARALMWKLIHSYSDYKKIGIMERPKIMQEYVDNFWKTVDKYHSFKEQFVEEAPGESLVAQDLYNVFAPWDLSQNPGTRTVGYGKFKQNMCRKDHLGPTTKLSGDREGWNGYRIKIASASPSSPTPSTVSVSK